MHYTTAEPSGQQADRSLWAVRRTLHRDQPAKHRPRAHTPASTCQRTPAQCRFRFTPSRSPTPTISTRLALDVVNAIGVPQSIPFTTPDETLTGTFVTYTATLPDDPHLPFTLVGVRFLSRTGSSGLEQVVYLDDLAYTTTERRARAARRFRARRRPGVDRQPIPDWRLRHPDAACSRSTSQSHAATGAYALRVQYNIVPIGAQLIEPVLAAICRSTAKQPIPIVLSSEYATTLGRRTLHRPLRRWRHRDAANRAA